MKEALMSKWLMSAGSILDIGSDARAVEVEYQHMLDKLDMKYPSSLDIDDDVQNMFNDWVAIGTDIKDSFVKYSNDKKSVNIKPAFISRRSR